MTPRAIFQLVPDYGQAIGVTIGTDHFLRNGGISDTKNTR